MPDLQSSRYPVVHLSETEFREKKISETGRPYVQLERIADYNVNSFRALILREVNGNFTYHTSTFEDFEYFVRDQSGSFGYFASDRYNIWKIHGYFKTLDGRVEIDLVRVPSEEFSK